jgi:hypothetical protein
MGNTSLGRDLVCAMDNFGKLMRLPSKSFDLFKVSSDPIFSTIEKKNNGVHCSKNNGRCYLVLIYPYREQ